MFFAIKYHLVDYDKAAKVFASSENKSQTEVDCQSAAYMNVGGFASSIGSNQDLTIDKNSIISKDEFQTTSLRSPIILKGTPKN